MEYRYFCTDGAVSDLPVDDEDGGALRFSAQKFIPPRKLDTDNGGCFGNGIGEKNISISVQSYTKTDTSALRNKPRFTFPECT